MSEIRGGNRLMMALDSVFSYYIILQLHTKIYSVYNLSNALLIASFHKWGRFIGDHMFNIDNAHGLPLAAFKTEQKSET